jgi:hypothetical protein
VFPRLLVALRGYRAGAVMLGSAGARASGGSCVLGGNAECGVELGKDVGVYLFIYFSLMLATCRLWRILQN